MLLATADESTLDCVITLSKDQDNPRFCVIDLELVGPDES
jgi:hypothetical protein